MASLVPINSPELENDSEQEPSYNARKIFIGGLSWSTTEEGLKQYFEALGAQVERLSIMRDKANGCSRGFGFVTFTTEDGLELVVSRRHTLDGRKIECKRAIPKNEIATKMRRVFVGGIPLNLEEKQLRKYFEKFGPVEECRIMTDRTSNRSRGFAFVCFYDDDVMNSVLTWKHEMDGKPFEVKIARVKQQMAIEAEASKLSQTPPAATTPTTSAPLSPVAPHVATPLIPSQIPLPVVAPTPTFSPPPEVAAQTPIFYPYFQMPAPLSPKGGHPSYYVYPTSDVPGLENSSYYFPNMLADPLSAFQPDGSIYSMHPEPQSHQAESEQKSMDMSSIQDSSDEVHPLPRRVSNRKTWTANPSKRIERKNLNRSLTASEAERLEKEEILNSRRLARNIVISTSPTSSRAVGSPPSVLISNSPPVPSKNNSPITNSPIGLNWSPLEYNSGPLSLSGERRKNSPSTDAIMSAVQPFAFSTAQDNDSHYLDRSLSLLRPDRTNRKSDSPIKRERQPLADHQVGPGRRRGSSIPQSFEKMNLKGMDFDWRDTPSSQKESETIEKYFTPIIGDSFTRS